MSSSVYIVEDHPLVRRMVGEAVRRMDEIEVCGTAGSGEEALAHLQDAGADVVLVDMALPAMSGAELIAALEAQHMPLRCIVLSGHSDPAYVDRAFEAGASGYVLKGELGELEAAIRQVLTGKTYLSPGLRPSD